MPRQYYAGLDWSASGHEVAVVDHHGQLVTRERVSDDPEGVRQLLRAYRRVAGWRQSVITGIEGGDGLVVAALRAADQPVMAVNPTIAARHRALHGVQRRKSDRGDALLLAQLVRSGQAGVRPLPQLSPLAVAIRETAHAHHHAVLQRQRCQARLRSLLARFHPNLLNAAGLLPDGLAGAQARALLAAAPTPARAARLTGRRIAAVLKQAGRSRRVADAADMLTAVLHRRPLRQPAAVEEAMGRYALALLATLNTAATCASTLAQQLEAALADHPQAPIYLSFPGLGPILAGRLLGEIGDDPARFADARALKAFAGATPLTWASGSSMVVRRRSRVNPLLATTGYWWAFGALTRSVGARAHYDRRREAGDRHASALRHLYARMLGQLNYCLREQVHYREDRAYPT